MAERVGGSSSGRTRGSGPRSGGSNPPPPANPSVPPARPHRLEAQDTALSRLKHGFESRWGHQIVFVRVFGFVFEEHSKVPRTRSASTALLRHPRLGLLF